MESSQSEDGQLVLGIPSAGRSPFPFKKCGPLPSPFLLTKHLTDPLQWFPILVQKKCEQREDLRQTFHFWLCAH